MPSPACTDKIPAGSTSATITIGVTDDALVEATETVTITGLTKTSGDADITVVSLHDALPIFDNDSATVSVTGTTNGDESGAVSVVFTVTQTAASSTDTVLTYSVGGTATAGSDYTAPSGTVTIPAGSTSATITISVTDDALVEATETVTITGLTKTAGDTDITVSGSSASLNLFDNDTATFSIDDAIADEGAGTITFHVTLSNPIDTNATI